MELEPMLAAAFEAKRLSNWRFAVVEPKLDGVRVIVRCHGEEVDFFSRNGNKFLSLYHLAPFFQELKLQKLTYFDGEAVAGLDFNEGSGLIRRQDEEAKDAKLHLFDIIDTTSITWPLLKRNTLLDHYIKDIIQNNHQIDRILRYHTAAEEGNIKELFQKFRSMGYEGAVVKNPDGPYVERRYHDWMKLKGVETHDVRIFDVFEGKGKYEKMLGGFYCHTLAATGEITGQVKVGGGFSDHERAEFWALWHTDQAQLLGMMIEVECHEKTAKGSLRHPRFLRLRGDKS